MEEETITDEIITTEQLETLKQIFQIPIETDEDYRKIIELVDEGE